MNYSFLYFSPHLDDVVLSCGGFLRKNYKKNQLVVNIFSGEYDGLTKWDLSSGIKNRKPIKIRKKEDQRALNLVKAEIVYLNFLDNLVFTDLKRSTRPFSDSSKITAQIFQIINKNILSIEAVFFPLDTFHPDHILISRIGRTVINKLKNRKIKIYFYEEFPHFIKNQFGSKGLFENYSPVYFEVNREIYTKIKMIVLYKSQLLPLLRILYPKTKLKTNAIEDIWKKILLNYHRDMAMQLENKDVKYCERFWILQ
jgi:LmbE family N-acetylglucosaminyl deacetylase